MYIDSGHIAKFYLNEPDSTRIRKLIASAATLVSSAWAIPEAACAFHRHCFVKMLPAGVYLRSGDTMHLTAAADLEEDEIWSNDRHLLAAAPHFGLRRRSA